MNEETTNVSTEDQIEAFYGQVKALKSLVKIHEPFKDSSTGKVAALVSAEFKNSLYSDFVFLDDDSQESINVAKEKAEEDFICHLTYHGLIGEALESVKSPENRAIDWNETPMSAWLAL